LNFNMNLWLVSNIRLDPASGLKASGIQNLRTAAALAAAGHRVLLWVDRIESGALAWTEEQMGRPFPSGLTFMQASARGREGEKRTAFSSSRERIWHIARGRIGAGTPDVVLTRSPTVIRQLRSSNAMAGRARLILELQYPEWSFLWRDWARRNPEAGISRGVRKLRELRMREAQGYAAADGILYASRAHEGLLEQAGYAGPRAWIPSSADAPESSIRPDDFEFDLGYVGSLAPENGLELLLEGIALIPNIRLGILGSGRSRYVRGLESRARELGVGERVHFAGRKAPAEVRSWMRRCGLGLVPVSGRCGPEKRMFASPLKLIEWMAAGVPVVASGVRSNLQHAEAGDPLMLFPPDDASALARTIQALLKNRDEMRSRAGEGLRAAGRRTFEARGRIVSDFAEEIGKSAVGAHGRK
jgi:glycosyltransferase involved in cell wall biosynthesis